MDGRWTPVSRDSFRDMRVILHPTVPIWEVRRGLDPGSDDSIDLSEFVATGSHSAFDASVTLKFNRELFGEHQPAPNQVLEIQFFQKGEWKTLWLGLVDSISSFNLSRGERSMQLTAKTREQQDIWKNVTRITPIFPQMTDLAYIIERVARSVSMMGDEIILPHSSFYTPHNKTQMAEMNAWDMIQTVCVALGWTPFIDGLGRLRMANRELQFRKADIVLDDSRLIKVGGQRQRPPKSRVRVKWRNSVMKKYYKQDQILGHPETITLGWFIPYWKRTVWFSEDKTLRAENTRINWETSVSVNEFAKTWLKFDFVEEKWKQQAENRGKLSFRNYQAIGALGAFVAMIASINTRVDNVAGVIPVIPPESNLTSTPGGPVTGQITIPPGKSTLVTVPGPKGSLKDAITTGAWATMAMTLGTGTYEIWGTPFDYVFPRNTSEAFDVSVPTYVDNVMDIESDFIMSEEHAKAVAIRELIYSAREANKWSATIVDDPRIEIGDILQFYDGSQLYVEDFSRSVERGSEATLEVKGFLIPVTKTVSFGVVPGSPPEPTGGGAPPMSEDIPAPGGGGGGGAAGGAPGGAAPKVALQNMQSDVAEYMAAHPDELADSCQEHGGSWDFMEGLVAFLQSRSSGRVGFNGKRGTSEASMDAIAYYHGDLPPTEGSPDVYIVDVIGGHCGPSPSASWNDVSAPAPGKWMSNH